MQSVCPAATAVARPPPRVLPRAFASGSLGFRQGRLRMGRAAAARGGPPATALRAQRGDGAEPPAEARDARNVPSERVQDNDEGLAPEQLELLEDEAMGGEDEGRSPTDYDRRAHIFEESSRVFRDLKHRRDGEGDGGVKVRAAAGGHG